MAWKSIPFLPLGHSCPLQPILLSANAETNAAHPTGWAALAPENISRRFHNKAFIFYEYERVKHAKSCRNLYGVKLVRLQGYNPGFFRFVSILDANIAFPRVVLHQ